MFKVVTLLGVLVSTNLASAGILFEPYYKVSSTKSIKVDRSKDQETETIKQREEKGLRAGLSFFSLFKLNLAVGQSFLVTTSTTDTIKDEYDEIDFNKELNTSTAEPGKEVKQKETQNNARVTLVFDPSFWIFIARLKAGITARQRIVELFQDDVLLSHVDPGITYKPNAGVGVGIKLTPNMYFMIEYGFYFYKFPETEPFEREATISYGFSI